MEVFRSYGILTKKSVLPIILILHRLNSQLVKCPSSQGQNKRNALSQYVCHSLQNGTTKIVKFPGINALYVTKLTIIIQDCFHRIYYSLEMTLLTLSAVCRYPLEVLQPCSFSQAAMCVKFFMPSLSAALTSAILWMLFTF